MHRLGFFRLCIYMGVLVPFFVNVTRAAEPPFVFKDVTKEVGLLPNIGEILGHGSAWGDIDGDGLLDLYVATFHQNGSKPNLLFRNRGGKFELDDQPSLAVEMRGTGVVFADLDNDGDLDLYIGSMPNVKNKLTGCTMFRNDGKGKFTNISKDNGACPEAFGGRSVAAVDFDGDGLLNLLVGEEPIKGYNGSKTNESRLFHNLGKLQFEDVTSSVGLPGVPGLGVGAADLNNDSFPDLFIVSARPALFLNDGKGKFRPFAGNELFSWVERGAKGDDMVCGVAMADVNRDGLLDIVLAQHFSRPWAKPVHNRLYLNRGIKDGSPSFEDVTEKVGLIPLGMKSPHVEIQDFDNDGLPDISFSTVKFKNGHTYPIIFKHLGIKDGLPQFGCDAWGVNDFPNASDQAEKRTGAFFDKMVKDRQVMYSAPGPVADFDNDGKLDIFMPNWWKESPSMLLKNETPGGNWLRVRVEGVKGINPMGIGTRINLYAPGKLGKPDGLLMSRDIQVGFGYASGQPAVAHFGLGKLESADLELVLPNGKGKITKSSAKANEVLTVKD